MYIHSIVYVTVIVCLPHCVVVCGWMFDVTVPKPDGAMEGCVVGETIS